MSLCRASKGQLSAIVPNFLIMAFVVRLLVVSNSLSNRKQYLDVNSTLSIHKYSLWRFADDINIFVHDANFTKSILLFATLKFDPKLKLILQLGKTNFTIFHNRKNSYNVSPDYFS